MSPNRSFRLIRASVWQLSSVDKLRKLSLPSDACVGETPLPNCSISESFGRWRKVSVALRDGPSMKMKKKLLFEALEVVQRPQRLPCRQCAATDAQLVGKFEMAQSTRRPS